MNAMVRRRIFWIELMILIFFISCSTREGDTSVSEAANDLRAYETDTIQETLRGPAGKVHVIEIRQMKFSPEQLTVHQGEQIVWVNRDIVEHDVTEQTHHAWSSSRLPPGSSWTMVAAESADYFCKLHQVMKGKLVVIK